MQWICVQHGCIMRRLVVMLCVHAQLTLAGRKDRFCTRFLMNVIDLCTTHAHHEQTSCNAVRSRSADTGRSMRPPLLIVVWSLCLGTQRVTTRGKLPFPRPRGYFIEPRVGTLLIGLVCIYGGFQHGDGTPSSVAAEERHRAREDRRNTCVLTLYWMLQ